MNELAAARKHTQGEIDCRDDQQPSCPGRHDRDGDDGVEREKDHHRHDHAAVENGYDDVEESVDDEQANCQLRESCETLPKVLGLLRCGWVHLDAPVQDGKRHALTLPVPPSRRHEAPAPIVSPASAGSPPARLTPPPHRLLPIPDLTLP